MSIPWSVLLYPKEQNVVPSTNNVMRLLHWLVEKGDIQAPTTEKPIKVGYLTEDCQDCDYSELFPAIDEKLETFLNTAQWCSISRGTLQKDVPFRGSISESFKIPVSEDERDWFTGLNGLYIWREGLRKEVTETNFGIGLISSSKVSHPFEESEEYFDLVWPRLKASGVIAEIEKILGFKLEATPHFD